MSARKAKRALSCPRANPYQRPCELCQRARTCSACVSTVDCEECTKTARCGPCRNAYSRLRRASGFSSARGTNGLVDSAPGRALEPAVDRIDLPRSRDGLSAYYRLLATTTDAARFFRRESSSLLQVETIQGLRTTTRPRRQCGSTRCGRLPSTETCTPQRDVAALPLVPQSRYWPKAVSHGLYGSHTLAPPLARCERYSSLA